MNDLTINQVRQKRAAAEKQIEEILSRLAQETGLHVRAVTIRPTAAAQHKTREGDVIGRAIAEAMKRHVDAVIDLEGP